jgi:hypothetical protein
METTDSPDKQIVGVNGIPRGCMSFPQGSPLHLLRQAWNQIDVLGRHLVRTSLDSLDGFLSNVAMLTLKSRQKNLTFCALNYYLEAFMPNDGHKAQSKRCRQHSQRNRPKGSDIKTLP